MDDMEKGLLGKEGGPCGLPRPLNLAGEKTPGCVRHRSKYLVEVVKRITHYNFWPPTASLAVL